VNGDATAPLPAVAEATLEDVLNACARLDARLEETQRLYRMAAAGSADSIALVGLSNQVADAKWWLCTELEKLAEKYDRSSKAMSIMDVIEQNPVPPLAAVPAVPQQRSRRRQGSHRQRTLGERAMTALNSVPGIAVGLAFLKRAAPAAGHGTVTKAISLKAALLAAAVPATGVLVVGAVVITHAGAGSSGGSHGSGGPDPAASVSASASPFPSSSLAGLTKPKPKHAGNGKHLLASAGLPLPVYTSAADPASSSPASSPSPAVSVQVGPAVLTGIPASLDLSSGVPETFTLTATGAGWVSWRVSTTGTDLDFSPAHGVLQAGGTATVTISLDASQDGLTSQVFTIDGQTVTVSLPLPVPVPTESVSIPPLVPSPSPS
jgi:hypothetical protein